MVGKFDKVDKVDGRQKRCVLIKLTRKCIIEINLFRRKGLSSTFDSLLLSYKVGEFVIFQVLWPMTSQTGNSII